MIYTCNTKTNHILLVSINWVCNLSWIKIYQHMQCWQRFLNCWVENFKIIGICHVILCFSYQKLLKRYIEIKVPQRQRKREETIRSDQRKWSDLPNIIKDHGETESGWPWKKIQMEMHILKKCRLGRSEIHLKRVQRSVACQSRVFWEAIASGFAPRVKPTT